jgi:hypothetical protein
MQKITANILFILFFTSCTHLNEEDKVLHASLVEGGIGSGIYFGLYKGNKYQFCDGDFLDHGCYTGEYNLSGDTITLYNLKQHIGIPSNRFLICRYDKLDSIYWQWKYPSLKNDWREMRKSDSLSGAEGDILPLNKKGELVLSKDNYFLIRYDKLNSN